MHSIIRNAKLMLNVFPWGKVSWKAAQMRLNKHRAASIRYYCFNQGNVNE